jgi:hypothetical protein
MTIRLLTSRVGPGISQTNGEVVDVPEKEARRMIATGQAAAIRDDVFGGTETETDQRPREHAVNRRRMRR